MVYKKRHRVRWKPRRPKKSANLHTKRAIYKIRGGYVPPWIPKMPTSQDTRAFVSHLGKRVAFHAGSSVLEHGMKYMDDWNPVSTMFHEFNKEHEARRGRPKDGGGYLQSSDC